MFSLPNFKDKSLLRCAFIHSSYRNEHPKETENNERLEFLGDALLGFIIASLLYEQYPQMDEGKLTKLRSVLVDEQQLAKFAKKLNIGGKMLLGNGAKLDGGCNNPNLLSSTFEAVVGAYYLDSGFKCVRDFLEPIFLEAAKDIVGFQSNNNYKSMLQEWSLSRFGDLPNYEIVNELGADHNKEFTAKVCLKGKEYGIGKGHKKQEAEKRAAADALKRLKQL